MYTQTTKTSAQQLYNQFRNYRVLSEASNQELRLVASHLGIKRGNMTRAELYASIVKIAPELA